jgi:hypothetical protein
VTGSLRAGALAAPRGRLAGKVKKTMPISGHQTNEIRDQFCEALEQAPATWRSTQFQSLCGRLWNCTDILPRGACDLAEVPLGSTYAQAARSLRRR